VRLAVGGMKSQRSEVNVADEHVGLLSVAVSFEDFSGPDNFGWHGHAMRTQFPRKRAKRVEVFVLGGFGISGTVNLGFL